MHREMQIYRANLYKSNVQLESIDWSLISIHSPLHLRTGLYCNLLTLCRWLPFGLEYGQINKQFRSRSLWSDWISSDSWDQYCLLTWNPSANWRQTTGQSSSWTGPSCSARKIRRKGWILYDTTESSRVALHIIRCIIIIINNTIINIEVNDDAGEFWIESSAPYDGVRMNERTLSFVAVPWLAAPLLYSVRNGTTRWWQPRVRPTVRVLSASIIWEQVAKRK